MENLSTCECDEDAKEKEWHPEPGPTYKDSYQNETNRDHQMEKGTNHYPYLWDNALSVKEIMEAASPGSSLHASWHTIRGTPAMETAMEN